VRQSGGEEETEDIGEMFAAYGSKGGSLKTGSRGNLNRLSPFSVSDVLMVVTLASCLIYARTLLEYVIFVMWVRSVTKILPSVKFAKDNCAHFPYSP